MRIKGSTFKIYIPHQEIIKKVNEMGEAISRDFKDKDPLFVAVLNGSFMFASDLMKAVDIASKISFIKLSSYTAFSSTGNIKEFLGLQEDIENKEIIILEDIVDTGNTISYVLDSFQKAEAASVSVASLLLKPEALQKEVEVKYVGFEIPNTFVVGYGLDYDGYGRNLKDLYQLAD